MEAEAMKYGGDLYQPRRPVILTQSLIEQFLHDERTCGRHLHTLKSYYRSLQDLYDFLPKGKEVTKEVLTKWKEALINGGFSYNTVNTKLVAVNGLLRYCGAEEFRVPRLPSRQEEDLPELTRQEYLQLLSAAYEMQKEREYLLIKVFACVGLNLCELDFLTVESIEDGVVSLPGEREKAIPTSLTKELLLYAEHQNLKNGTLFVTRSGRLVDRSNITHAIHGLAEAAGVDSEKCNPRVLHRLYLATHEEILENLEPYYVQSYDQLLVMEHSMLDWE